MDLGSFVLFYHGVQILADIGRIDYTCSSLSLYGRSAHAHNALFVDGLGAQCDGPGWLLSRHRAVHVDVEVTRTLDTTNVCIRHNGFARLAAGVVSHQRRLSLDPTRMRIEDQLKGTGTHRVQARFQFAPGLSLLHDSQRSWTLTNTPLKFITDSVSEAFIQVGSSSTPFGGLFFPAYGCQQTCQTLEVSTDLEIPAALTHVLILET